MLLKNLIFKVVPLFWSTVDNLSLLYLIVYLIMRPNIITDILQKEPRVSLYFFMNGLFCSVSIAI